MAGGNNGAERRARHDGSSGSGGSPGTGGIPDGLLVGLLGFLVALTVLVWAAAGISGLLAHGSWPSGAGFAETPLALRRLLTEPGDLAGAWPGAAGELSGPGLFWGILIGEVMVLTVLAVFAIGTVARWRATRRKPHTVRTDRTDPTEGAHATDGPKDRAGDAALRDLTAGPPHPAAEHPNAFPGAAPPPDRPPAGPNPPAHPEDTPTGAAMPPAGPGIPSHHAPDAAGLTGTGTPYDTTAAHAGHEAPATARRAALPGPTPPGPPYDQQNAAPAYTGAPGLPGSPELPDPGTTTAVGVSSAGVAPPPGTPVSATRTPGLPAPAPTPAVEPLTRAPRGLHFLGLDGADDRRRLALRAIADAEGPLLVVSSEPALWTETKDARGKLGPTHVYDPGQQLDTPVRLRWSPVSGCEARETAALRATALLAPVRPQHALDSATADAAETLLRCWLHAAAVDGRAIRQVHRWASGTSAHEPVRILRTNRGAAAGSAGELEATLTAHPERRDMALQLTARALSALSSVHIRNACNPTRAESLALESFIAEGGTLYVMGEAIEDPRTHPGAMPFLTALASSVVEHGRSMAERSSAGRLDPPLTVVLDDVARVAPLPQLPGLLGTGSEQGMPTLALLRSQEQARARWPQHFPAG
ncbi:hypothetical protein [Streptomyces albus]|uniref:hypothetical protein n=1 Tax=Streptomyces albus TaxID=1888 RepID=UPI000ABAD1D4|nr:hypothetical protein [Streptomyces albus]